MSREDYSSLNQKQKAEPFQSSPLEQNYSSLQRHSGWEQARRFPSQTRLPQVAFQIPLLQVAQTLKSWAEVRIRPSRVDWLQGYSTHQTGRELAVVLTFAVPASMELFLLSAAFAGQSRSLCFAWLGHLDC